MILVDTSIWLDHLHASELKLVELLGVDQVGCHSLVVEEMALGSIARRDVLPDLLANLYQFTAMPRTAPRRVEPWIRFPA